MDTEEVVGGVRFCVVCLSAHKCRTANKMMLRSNKLPGTVFIQYRASTVLPSASNSPRAFVVVKYVLIIGSLLESLQ